MFKAYRIIDNKDTKKRYIVAAFPSLPAMVNTLKNAGENNAVMRGRSSSSKDNTGDNWSGTDTLETAYSLAVNGWGDPLDKLQKGFAAKVAQTQTTPVRRGLVADFVGCLPLVPAVLAGVPQTMLRPAVAPRKVKTMRLFYAVSVNWTTKAEEMINSGCALLSLIKALELGGWRVRLDVLSFCADYNDETFLSLATLKDYRQPLDLKKLAFPFINPAYLRRIGFKALETVDGLKENGFSSAYGHGIETPEKVRAALTACGLVGDNDKVTTIKHISGLGYDVSRLAGALGVTI